MEKKITSISIENFRGYFGRYEPLKMNDGQNLLIYGENGSGKSSLYKALNTFFYSSRDNSVQYIKNRYQLEHSGKIEIEFSDYDNNQIVDGSGVSYSFSNETSNHNILFIQNTSLVKGFLDYTDLLKVYFHNESEPNLFELIIINLLGEHVPIQTGGNFRFRDRWEQLQEDLTTNAYTRNSRCHQSAIAFLPVFEIHLRGTLDEVFTILNNYLSTYFSDFNIQLEYSLAPLNFKYGPKWDWHTTSIFKLRVFKDSTLIQGGYNDFLNEARLSAIAVCLYLASLRTNPTAVELKVLFLDDVFIGLDAGNRIPILEILRHEFPDFQKFISTYDRHWFELAKRYFSINNSEQWKAIEMYVGNDVDPSTQNSINKPIIIDSLSHFERGLSYLNNRINPDYPAAANYFRKAFEELITKSIPEFWTVSEDLIKIPGYKLGFYVNKLQSILKIVGENTVHIDTVNSMLNVLLHPLSHHEISTPIYRQEIEIISKSYMMIREQLINLNLKTNYKCKLEAKRVLKITFVITDTISQYYEIRLKEPLILDIQNQRFIDSKCYIYKLGKIENGKETFKQSIPKKSTHFNYSSLKDSVDKIYNYITTVDKKTITKPSVYLDVLKFFDGTEWVDLKE